MSPLSAACPEPERGWKVMRHGRTSLLPPPGRCSSATRRSPRECRSRRGVRGPAPLRRPGPAGGPRSSAVKAPRGGPGGTALPLPAPTGRAKGRPRRRAGLMARAAFLRAAGGAARLSP